MGISANGFIAKEDDPEKLVVMIAQSNLQVCGSKVVRNELRQIPFRKNEESRRLRNKVLGYYSVLIKDKRDYNLNAFIRALAKEYEKAYAGKNKANTLSADFLIVATASLHAVKIVCSNDEKTMKEPSALKAYRKVNEKFQLPEPEFMSYEELKKILK